MEAVKITGRALFPFCCPSLIRLVVFGVEEKLTAFEQDGR